MTARPPSSTTPSPNLISVPRPAMFVAIVTECFNPAFAIISASRAWFFAFKISCSIRLFLSINDSISDVSTAIVPIKIGCPSLCLCSTSLHNASNLASS